MASYVLQVSNMELQSSILYSDKKVLKNFELTKNISFRDFVFVGDIGNLELMLKINLFYIL